MLKAASLKLEVEEVDLFFCQTRTLTRKIKIAELKL